MAQPMDRTGLERALAALGDVLAYRGEAYEIVLVGGGDLVLRGIVSRSTKDADIVGQWLAGPYDLICFKLYAAADHWSSRDRNLDDLRALRPTKTELLSGARWSMTHDPSPAFRSQLTAVLRHLGVEDADERLD